MTSADAGWARGGGSRPATPAGRRTGDSPEVAEGRGIDTPPDRGEPEYVAPALGRPAPEPVKVPVVLVVVDGAAGRALLAKQAAAVRRALEWFADHPATPPEVDDAD